MTGAGAGEEEEDSVAVVVRLPLPVSAEEEGCKNNLLDLYEIFNSLPILSTS
jgi:hypothetical protein